MYEILTLLGKTALNLSLSFLHTAAAWKVAKWKV